MTQAQDSGNLERAQVHNLVAAAVKLLERAAAAPAGRAALTLVPGAGAALKQTLLALVSGVHLAEHDASGAATLQVLWGRVRLVTSEERWELGPGDHLQLPPTRHRLESLEDAVVLLTVVATPPCNERMIACRAPLLMQPHWSERCCPARPEIDEVEWPGGCRYRITETSASLHAMSRRSTIAFTPSD